MKNYFFVWENSHVTYNWSDIARLIKICFHIKVGNFTQVLIIFSRFITFQTVSEAFREANIAAYAGKAINF